MGQRIEEAVDSESDIHPGLRASVVQWASLFGQHWSAQRDGRAPRPPQSKTTLDTVAELVRQRCLGPAADRDSDSDSVKSWMWASGDSSEAEQGAFSIGSASGPAHAVVARMHGGGEAAVDVLGGSAAEVDSVAANRPGNE